jgi:hypothetical protein
LPNYGDESLLGGATTKVVLGIMLIFALVIPYSIRFALDSIIGPVYNIYAVVWYFRSDTIPPIKLGLGDLISTLIIALPRIWFAFETERYFKNSVTRKHALGVGIISEMVVVVPIIWSYIANPESHFGLYYVLVIPLPTLLIAGLIMIFTYPHCKENDKGALSIKRVYPSQHSISVICD